MGVMDMLDILVVGQDMDKVVVVVYNMVMDKFSYSDEYTQEHMVWVVLAIQGTRADLVRPYSLEGQVGQVDLNIRVHQDSQVDLEGQVDLHNTLEYKLVHRLVDTGLDTRVLVELLVREHSNLEYT